MKGYSTSALMLGSLTLGATLSAQAACLFPEAFPTNDVSLDGFAFEAASTSPPTSAFEVDMNGIQGGLEIPEPWATHGTLVVTVDSDGRTEWIASWTQNTFVDSLEWVCRLRLDEGTTVAVGTGAVTSTVFFGGTRPLQQCRLDLVGDCP